MSRIASAIGSTAIMSFVGCADPGVTESTRVPVCDSGGALSMTPGTGAGGSTMTGSGGAQTAMGGTTGTAGVPGMGGATAGSPGMGGTPGAGGDTTTTGGASGAAGVTGAGGAEQPPGPCPSGYMCVDLSSLGATAVDGAGKPVTASCGMGAPSASCDDANPKSTCPGLPDPLCAHVSVAGMQIVSCGQRCTP